MSCQQGTSATDIITYVGVPLAVLGVLPILWNSIRSFWIRHHLVSLIPVGARKNTSLTIDPAAGVVIVVLDDLDLRWQDILSLGCQQISLAARKLDEVDPRLAGCSWMGLYRANVPLFKIKGSFQRVVVDASLRFKARGIHCDRQTLLFLALGLGVDPYRNRLDRNLSGTEGSEVALVDGDGRAVMSISSVMTRSYTVQLCSSISFSERRALAWFCVMMVYSVRGLLYIPLASSKNAYFTMPPSVTTMREGIQWLGENNISLELALTWTFYAESVFYDEGNEELLPVPQIVLKAREDALVRLKSLPDNDLKAHLSIIFSGDTPLMDKTLAILNQALLESVPVIRDGKRKGRKRMHIKDCQTCMNLYGLIPRCSVLRELYNTVKPNSGQRSPRPLFDDNSSPVATAAQIWLGLSIIQLWQREEWESKLSFSGTEEAKPSLELVQAILTDLEDPLRNQVICID